ncbi:sugar-binding protein [Streptomyces rugosispiralis]|uniref:Glycosyl hydrolase n=1 Tax=Streptomyces rugosispiralis TaxID=2967341 RepID=A0ABT1V5F3_9ACTN|nr:sugar-binding protein [Streptomyces rugosispiralis]MCQ8192618.1 glycosyl hydrolase [Streptomyces rugosispiralis]
MYGTAPVSSAAGAPKAEAAMLTLKQTAMGNIFAPSVPRTVVANTTDTSVRWTLSDVDGATVKSGSVAPSGGAATITIPASVPYGWYSLTATDTSGDKASTTLATVAAPPARTGRFGVATHYSFGRDTSTQALILPSGAVTVRDEASWARAETAKGVLDWTAAHKYLDPLFAKGIRPLLIADYGNNFYDGGQGPTTDAGRAAFAKYAAGMAKEFGSHIAGIEVWNEWDVGTGHNATRDPENYVALLKAASTAIKAADPSVPVLGPAVANLSTAWLETTFQKGALSYVDAVIAHPYNWPAAADGLGPRITAVQSLVRKYNNGADKPLWITENGWPTGTDVRAVSETDQARNTAKAAAIATFHGVAKYYVYDFIDDGDDPANPEHNFGLVHSGTNTLGAYTPKPSYAAWATATRQLAGAKPLAPVTTPSGVTDLRFQTADGGRVQAVWADKATTLSFPGATGNVLVTDMSGGSRVVSPVDGKITVQASASPVWIRGVLAAPTQTADKFVVEPAVTSEAARAHWTVQNPDPAKTHEFRLTVGHTSATARVGPGVSRDVALSLPARSTPASVVYRAAVTMDGKPFLRLSATGKVRAPISVDGTHSVTDDGKQSLRLNVTNAASTAAKIKSVTWKVGSATGSSLEGASVAAKETAVLTAPLPALTSDTNWSATATMSDGATYQASGTLHQLDQDAVTTVPRTSVDVDGTVDSVVKAQPGIDLDAAPFVPTTSGTTRPTGFGGKAWYDTDASNLYLTAVVSDRVHHQDSSGASIWQGDSLQFTVARGGPGEQTRWNELGAALTSSGPQLYRWLDPADPARATVDGAKIAVSRDDDAHTTTYEIALPWASLGGPQASDGLFSSSLVVNDADGATRLGWITWGGGIADGKDPAKFHALHPQTT